MSEALVSPAWLEEHLHDPSVRVIEIAFSVSELLPASICRLFDEASQENTSSVIDSW